MSWGKPRGREGLRPVFVYHPGKKRKVYVGQVKTLNERRKLEREKSLEFANPSVRGDEITGATYAKRWLDVKHGPNTRRPAPTTLAVNRGFLKAFLEKFGDRKLVSITRWEALDWASENPRSARAASAMFNDAVDDEILAQNVFANRRQKEDRGRRDIAPLTEAEVETLASLAIDIHGLYGRVVAGWILFMAWTGVRPGEAWQVRWDDLDWEEDRVRIHRIKGHKETQRVVFPVPAQEAVRSLSRKGSSEVFLTPRGKPYNKGNAGYFWRPVKAGFIATLEPDRKAELLEIPKALDPYALRHHCASIMAARGLNEFDISEQLGNSPEICRKRYIHPFRNEVMDRVAGALDRAPVYDLTERRRRNA